MPFPPGIMDFPFPANRERLRQILSKTRRAAVTMALLVATAQTLSGALPPGWSQADLTGPAIAGSGTYDAGTWTLSGGGASICDNDQFHFAWTSINGDAWMIAKVESIQY